MKKRREKVSSHGPTADATKANGKTVNKRVVVYSETKKECKRKAYGQLGRK
jgi:hypothetical protein